MATVGTREQRGPAMDTVREICAHIDRGMIPAHVYSDPAVFEHERERIFGRAWLFVAHESEIPRPGDYVVRRIVDDSFIVVRDAAGSVRVHFNMCIHRGMQVCRAEQGNASHFRCPYHGWSYRNDGSLAGLPFHDEAYGGEDGFPRSGQGLVAPEQVDAVNGLIFVSLDAGAPPLREYIGEFTYYLDFYTRQSSSGLEVRGPQRWRVRANWKIGCENFVGDMYHTPYTHRSVVDINLFREPKAHKRKEGAVYFAGKGGGTTYKLPAGDFVDRMRYVGYPDEQIARMRESWSASHVSLVEDSGFMVSAATLFPNLSLVHNWPQVDDSGEVTPFISIRQWQPVTSTETEVLSWFAVDAEAPDEYKRRSYKAYLMCFGSSGMFEQDDVENWVSITDVSRGSMARRLLLNSRMGLTADDRPLTPPLADFAGPGVARVGYGEHNQRSWLGLWAGHLANGASTATVHQSGAAG
jgi:phenylpropionate dioxygenase-like ring-hydroxylating dioxygenase large terminal subunit